jgi:hypothetical protein
LATAFPWCLQKSHRRRELSWWLMVAIRW